jgi:hypothetical protein
MPQARGVGAGAIDLVPDLAIGLGVYLKKLRRLYHLR